MYPRERKKQRERENENFHAHFMGMRRRNISWREEERERKMQGHSGDLIPSQCGLLPNQQGWKLSRDTHTACGCCTCLAPNRTVSRHSSTIIISVVLCYKHVRVHSGIKSDTQLAPSNKIDTLLPFLELSCKFMKGPVLVGITSVGWVPSVPDVLVHLRVKF